MIFGSLFAGIGGFDLGLERAGMTCKWQVENNPFCQKVLAKHWPDVKRYGDIKELDPKEFEPVDLICGGFPCQPFSQAGKRKGKKDDRYLWPEMLRIITQKRPAWVFCENVAGIIGLALDGVLLDLENQGYATRTFIIPACAVDAKHRRDRVWIVGHTAHAERWPSEYGRGDIESRHNGTGQAASEFRESSEDVADASRHEQRRQEQRAIRERVGQCGESVAMADSTSERSAHNSESEARSGFTGRDTVSRSSIRQPADSVAARWLPEPDVRRVAHGIPNRVDRLRGLGNAVVPQVVEVIGRVIMEAHAIRR